MCRTPLSGICSRIRVGPLSTPRTSRKSPGPLGVAAELSDPGNRSHRLGCGQCLAIGRGNRCCRGHVPGHQAQQAQKALPVEQVHPQTLSVVKTRAEALELEIVVGPIEQADLPSRELAGILLQYPDTYGDVKDFEDIAALAKKNGVS